MLRQRSSPEASGIPIANASFYSLTYPQQQRDKEARLKKVFGIFNGVGWAATFVGGLTLTGIGTMGLGTEAIIILSSTTLPVGTVGGFFIVLDEIKEDQKQEKELIASINQQLLDAQAKQVQLFIHVLEAEDLLLSKLRNLAAELKLQYDVFVDEVKQRDELLKKLAVHRIFNSTQQSEFKHLVLLARSIMQIQTTLIPIYISENIKYKDKTFSSTELNNDIEAIKSCSHELKVFCENETCQQIIAEKTKKETANKPIIVVNPPVDPPNTVQSGIFGVVKTTCKKIFTAGYGAGIGFGIGTIFCGIALASNPPGWAILATLVGIAVTAIAVAVITYYVEQNFKNRHKENMQKLQELKTTITDYRETQSKHHLDLQQACADLKEFYHTKRMNLSFTVTPTPAKRTSQIRRVNSCSSLFEMTPGVIPKKEKDIKLSSPKTKLGN